MAHLILETGAGLSNSNSYADLTYADDYFSYHPYHADAWANITDEEMREALLIAATTFLDVAFDWRGYRLTETQALDWPRYGVYDDERFPISQNVIPERLKKATCEQAFFLSKGDPSAEPVGAGITELRVDVIQLTFDKAVRTSALPSNVVMLLRDFGEYSFARRIRKVIVG